MAVLQVRHGAVTEPAVGRLWVHLVGAAHSASFMPGYSHVRSIMDTLIFFGAVRCSAGPLGGGTMVWQGEPAGRPRSRFAGIEESPASTGQGAGEPPVRARRRTVPQRADRRPASRAARVKRCGKSAPAAG